MLNIFLINFGKILSKISKTLNLGNGSTWPGHIALRLNKNLIREVLSRSNLKIIFIAGTNGKTTTSKLIHTALAENGYKVIQNQSGANLLNGIASTLIAQADIIGRLYQDFAIFEVDENSLPLVLKDIHPKYLLMLNLFRDQLDRYGEIDEIARKWKEALKEISRETTLILNADDPVIAYLGVEAKTNVFYFGLEDKRSGKVKPEHAADSIYCPACGAKLNYSVVFYSHLGIWRCDGCGFRRTNKNLLSSFSYYPLSGEYNASNTLAGVCVLKQIGLSDKQIIDGFKKFEPAFGRQEKIFYKGKSIQIFLSKNPTGFNESLRTIEKRGAKTVLFVLNDGPADGRDVSWIWDIDIPMFENVIVSGTRAYDMGLRMKYEEKNRKSKIKKQKDNKEICLCENLEFAIKKGLDQLGEKEIFYVLPTYTAMLEVRKILTGRSIL